MHTSPTHDTLGASVDSEYAHRAWVKHGLGTVRFPMLGDASRALAQGFGMLAGFGVAVRVTFNISPEGRVLSVAANDPNAGRSARETLRLLHALQNGQLTACEWQPGQAFIAAA